MAEWSTNNALHLNPSKSFLLIVSSQHCYSVIHCYSLLFSSLIFLLILFQFFAPPLLRFLMYILTLHGQLSYVAVKCRAAYARLCLFYPLRHLVSILFSQKLLTSQLLVFSLFDFADVVHVSFFNQYLLNRV